MSSKNRYKKNALKKHFLEGMNTTLVTKGNFKNSALETGKDILVGVLGGGLIGSAIGRPSLLIGILTTGAGHYSGNRLVQLLGIGMMAANGFQKSSTTTNGLDGLDGIKDRIKAYRESFAEKLYLDKLKKKNKISAATTSGFGEVQYFTYPADASFNESLAALDDIEEQIEESARQFSGQLNAGGYEEEFRGNDYLLEGADDKLY